MTDLLQRRADAITAMLAALSANGKLDGLAASQVDALACYVVELVKLEFADQDVRRMRFQAASRNQAAILSRGKPALEIGEVAVWAIANADGLLKRLGYEVPDDG